MAENAPQGDGQVGALTRKAHATIAKVTDDVGRRYAFNTAISAVMELVNELHREPHGTEARFAAETAVSLLQPYAPHVTEELWQRLGRERLWEEPWPVADTSLLERATFELVVQVNGKVRDRVEVPADASEDELVAAARGVRARAQLHRRCRSAADDRRAPEARQHRARVLRDELTHIRHEAVTHV